MLYLYQSNQLESLAAQFSELTNVQPLTNTFDKEIVWVQSKGMGRFLNLYLAERQGICANIDFTLPASFIWQLMKNTLPEAPEHNIYNLNILNWRILSLLQSGQFNHFSVIKHYVKLGDIATLDLANKIAKLYDQYLVYRPDWINAWTENKLLNLGEDEAWQQALWQALVAQTQNPHRVILWQKLLNRLSAAQLPERITVFGLASLAPMYLDLLSNIAKHIDVHLFTLNPSQEYWGDLIEAQTILKQPEDYQNLSLSGHPLLSSLGKQGQEFFDNLNELTISQEFSVFSQNEHSTLLALLQNDLLHLKLPECSALAQKNLTDKSIQIHSAHSPLRELQILKDCILDILNNDSALTMNDIAVLTPNIETYTALIPSVFGKTGDNIALPFSISDTSIGRNSPLIFAFKALLNFFKKRFEVEHVLDLLETLPISAKFNLTKHDIDTVRYYVQNNNIHWGVDKDMRKEHGDDSEDFTWIAGLKRLALGFVLSPQPNSPLLLWQAHVPDKNSFMHKETLSSFILFLNQLKQTYQTWRIPCTIEQWVERLQKLLGDFFDLEDTENHIPLTQIEQLLIELANNISLSGYAQSLSYELICQQLNLDLDKKSDHNFLKSGITFCSMIPMRSLPFKVLCLIGLNDADFPRDEKAVNFDLMAPHPKKGDRSRRDDDRYLFLEAIISARQKLYLSYIGQDIRTDESLPPSTLVNELLDTLASMTARSVDSLTQQFVIRHPLQAFSKHYFIENNEHDFFSFQQQFAEALNQSHQEKPSFLADLNLEKQIIQEIYFTDLALFWRNPVRHWLKNNLNWQTNYLENTQQSEEPFSTDKDSERIIMGQLLHDKMNNLPFEHSLEIFEAQNIFPAGQLGQLSREEKITKIKKLTIPDIFKETPLGLIDFNLTVASYHLTGTLTNLYPSGRALVQSTPLNAPEKIVFLLNHLILCASAPEHVKITQSILLSSESSTTLNPLDKAQALEILNLWLDYYCLGQTEILPFFPRTHLKTAQTYMEAKEKPNAKDLAMTKAHAEFYGNSHSSGESQSYNENVLVFDDKDSPPLEQPLFWNMVIDLILPLIRLEASENE